MTSTSSLLNTPLRQHVSPVLREAGFPAVDARNGWRWDGDFVSVFSIRAVGSYFSQSAGWPPGSVCVWLGVFFTFAPRPPGLKDDKEGRPLPPEHLCHMRSHLSCGLDQSRRLRALPNELERVRQDIWWVERDGSNAGEVAADIAKALRGHGLRWFAQAMDLRRALAESEAMRDCFAKFSKAAMIARHLGDDERWKRYDELAEREAIRIGQSTDRQTWLGL